MSNKDIFQRFLDTYNSFAITAHANPDPDALGSAVATYKYLELNGKEAILVLDAKIPANLKFLLKGVYLVSYEEFLSLNHEIEATISLDCSNRERTYTQQTHLLWSVPVLNIDHHPDNNNFGNFNIVNKKAAATGEILFSLFSQSDSSINYEIAQAIYVALIGDTGGFRYGNTSAIVLDIAAKLLRYKLDVAYLNTQVLERQSKKAFKLVSSGLNEVEFFENVSTMTISYEMLKEHDIDSSQLPELVNYIRSIEGVDISVLFLEVEPDFTKVSLRSQPHINISKVAKFFGGGGHKNAAGCKINGPLAQTKQLVNNQILKHISKEAN